MTLTGSHVAPASPVETTTLYGLFVRDRKTAVAVGSRGAVVTTEDGGDHWALRPTDVKDHLASVSFAGENLRRGWAVGTYGRIVSTDDGGRTWRA